MVSERTLIANLVGLLWPVDSDSSAASPGLSEVAALGAPRSKQQTKPCQFRLKSPSLKPCQARTAKKWKGSLKSLLRDNRWNWPNAGGRLLSWSSGGYGRGGGGGK